MKVLKSRMQRSSTSGKVSGDENYRSTSEELLPSYNPQSHIATKQQNQIRSAEAAIHLIPFLLLICAIILWFFSDTGSKMR